MRDEIEKIINEELDKVALKEKEEEKTTTPVEKKDE